MITKINENISIWQEFNPIELAWGSDELNSTDPRRIAAKFGFNKQRILIRDQWFDVIHQSELVRRRDKKDGYYRVIYIQINMETGEYYIGKANRPKWSEIKRYQGSGLKFKNKFKKSRREFVRYFIGICKTAEETEKLEASIVEKDLLSDEKCLNLVAGGGGTTSYPTLAETSEKKREHMKNNPEQFKPMLQAAKEAFLSGDTPALRARSQRIKEVMNTDEYREMTRERILKWQKENPEEHKAWQEKLIKSRTSQKAKEKRKASLKKWNKENPLEAHANAKRRAKAAAAKTSKGVSMLDLESGKILRNFPSAHAAARWLVEAGIAKNTNCVSSISSVCLRKPCTTGYGFRKKAYGYDWRFTDDL